MQGRMYLTTLGYMMLERYRKQQHVENMQCKKIGYESSLRCRFTEIFRYDDAKPLYREEKCILGK